MAKDKPTRVLKGKAGNIKKTYTLSSEEKSILQNTESVMGILQILRDGLRLKLTAEVEKIKLRVGVSENNPPEGFDRIIQMDPNRYELMVFDIKKGTRPPEPVEELKN